MALFREFKALLGEVEAYQRSQAAQQAEADRAAAAAARAAAEAEAKVSPYFASFRVQTGTSGSQM